MSTRIPAHRSSIRKAPRQLRSKATVEAIVAAAAHILGARGWAGFNTNAVAERAGVSIGSLYQYFPDKQALTDAVRQAHLQDVLGVVERCVAGRKSLAQRVAELVDGLVDAHRLHPGLHRTLLEGGAPASLDAASDPYEARYMACYEWLARRHGGGTDAREATLVAQVLSDAVDGAIHNAARRRTLHDPALHVELTAMVCGHLRTRARRTVDASGRRAATSAS